MESHIAIHCLCFFWTFSLALWDAQKCLSEFSWFSAQDLSKPFDVKGVGEAQRIELRIATSEPVEPILKIN